MYVAYGTLGLKYNNVIYQYIQKWYIWIPKSVRRNKKYKN
jgi:hypothetical protein